MRASGSAYHPGRIGLPVRVACVGAWADDAGGRPVSTSAGPGQGATSVKIQTERKRNFGIISRFRVLYSFITTRGPFVSRVLLLPASRRRASAAIDVRPFPPAKSFLSRPDGRDQRNGPDALGSREVTAGPRPLDQVLASGSHYAEDMTESPLLSSACVG